MLCLDTDASQHLYYADLVVFATVNVQQFTDIFWSLLLFVQDQERIA
jgi:hypothetical protein